MQISNRINDIPMSGIRKMFDLAGPNSINLGLGEPDLAPPKEAIEGMNKAASGGLNKYGPTAGIPQLRQAVADRFRKYGDITGDNIMITPSGSSALLEITMSVVNPGDDVLVPSPGFVIYGPHAQLAGGTYTEYKLTDGDFQPDIDDIQSKITPKTKMIVVTTPSNPTGGVLNEESYKALCDIAADKNITIMADEVYESFIYEGKHLSFMDQLDKAIVASGFSKMMAVTGWRMGFLCASKEMMEYLIKMQYHVCASPNMPAMYGILNALPNIDPYLDNARKVYRARRDLICKRINEIPGMSIQPPKGAFYAFPSYDMDMKSADLAAELVKAGLICTPGSAFGKYGEGHLRFSYAADETKINAGMDILESTMKKLR
ncbi:MAG: aminotransferase class I/II-fold pyridoxal phosphate-dependent enzyme [Candidatus Methanomethylophilaceae archaeon]|nr:aminotransferase class I/II-fold pyridoxal phosphate-dependent enzyme [Candidatus Methanomethylophilaceae archaeon]MBR6214148.1 aminotransferase class I/II-fold pyridoxal phosphate-dependent enzyme [Candidatus Methanomethylophilaceae archaeon]